MDFKDFSDISRSQGTNQWQIEARMNVERRVERLTRTPQLALNRERRNLESQQSGLGKKDRGDTYDTEFEYDSTSVKQYHTSPQSMTADLCETCKGICWTELDKWLTYEGIISWWGKPVCKVKDHFRRPPDNPSCPLCRQLYAPWINGFLERLDPSKLKGKDAGDEIHIFRNLRHLPHVNDYQRTRMILKEHNAPYHIAVVPIVKGWKKELQAHIAENGMVVIVPTGKHPAAEIFVPKQVSKGFDPDIARHFVRRCKHHRELCKPKTPDVKGMKVIDCQPPEPVIRRLCPGDKYVALSYVWGPSTLTHPSRPAESRSALRTESTGNIRSKPLKSIPHNIRHNRSPSESQHKKSILVKSPANWIKTFLAIGIELQMEPRQQLPVDVPLTIRDAIQVTKALGYHYLWVDKYCIDQDDENEKQQQFGQMGNIYAGSQVTIFALGVDSHAGLPGVSGKSRLWQQQRIVIGEYEFVHTLQDPHYSINHSMWATRAWTLQEGLFSTRRLFFTDHQIYFECNAMNCSESFRSNLKHLHIRSGQRFRAFHRAGNFVCGNSNQFSHVNVRQSTANHRKVDTIRRCEWQTRQYTKRELTDNNDVLNAYLGIAQFYAKTTAQIYSLAGLAIPFPIAKLRNIEPEYLDHLSYALAWSHRPCKSNKHGNTQIQYRAGFPSWSWAGWIGEIRRRGDLPYYWTSRISSVSIGFQSGDTIDYSRLHWRRPNEDGIFYTLMTAKVLYFKAYVLEPTMIPFWYRDACTGQRKESRRVHVYMSTDHCTLDEFRGKLVNYEYECVVLGVHGEPREDVFKAIQLADRKKPNARNRRIELIVPRERHALVCLILRTDADGGSERVGLLKVELMHTYADSWELGAKRTFLLK